MKWYCIKCLNVFGRGLEDCPACLVALRKSKSGVVRRLISRLKRQRGLKPPKKKSHKDWYKEYLQSEAWKTIRERILKRDGNVCQRCWGTAEVVHHKSYAADVLAGLNDSQLISLCSKCHEEIEFSVVDGKTVKNSLAEANRKLGTEKQRKCSEFYIHR